ncbi:DNA cytosine methyltransferase (plasmid) [Guyparkeria sp. 1SP6A2]|nr:DNA cytosine methyltransferase [Guyparkeria sp. 1SP6A2]
MSAVIYTKLGEHRGRKRLWLEGQRLASQGVTPGSTFQLEATEGRLVLRFVEDGDRRVSRRSRRGQTLPVIDITAEELAAAVGNAERLRVVVRDGAIYVTVHHHEQAERERFARTLDTLANGRPVSIGSLAHGAGILDHAIHAGLDRAGVASRLAFAVEVDSRYLDASLANNPVWDRDSIAIHAPMEEVEPGKLPPVDVLTAGLPCTGASVSGRSKNRLGFAEQHETAGPLFLAFLNIVQATRPSVILLENVVPYRSSMSYHVIGQVLRGLGYRIEDTTLEGNAMGALESRERLCMVATTADLPAVGLDTLTPVRAKEATVADILDPIPADSPRWKEYAYLEAKQARDTAAGKGFRRQLLTGDEPRLGTVGAGYNRARSTEPFIVHPTDSGRSRLLTPAEHARAKAAPESLIDGLSATVAHEVLGNGVIHPAFVAVGERIGAVLGQMGCRAVAA